MIMSVRKFGRLLSFEPIGMHEFSLSHCSELMCIYVNYDVSSLCVRWTSETQMGELYVNWQTVVGLQTRCRIDALSQYRAIDHSAGTDC